jgi:hypothetical protein
MHQKGLFSVGQHSTTSTHPGYSGSIHYFHPVLNDEKPIVSPYPTDKKSSVLNDSSTNSIQ